MSEVLAELKALLAKGCKALTIEERNALIHLAGRLFEGHFFYFYDSLMADIAERLIDGRITRAEAIAYVELNACLSNELGNATPRETIFNHIAAKVAAVDRGDIKLEE